MKFHVLVKNPQRRQMIEAACHFFADSLRIKQRQHTILVMPFDTSRTSEGIEGSLVEVLPQVMSIGFTPRARFGQQLQTIAHEFVHIKQLTSGKLHMKHVRGKTRFYWKGVDLTQLPHYLQPWEIEAMSKEVVLTHQFMGSIDHLASRLSK